MFYDRYADEFITRMWNAGTSWAFIIVTSYALLRIIILMILQPLSSVSPKIPGAAQFNQADPHFIPILLLSFFGAVLIQRYRNR
nr:hypothetical protein [uncultured Sphingomonas sp.]